MYHPHCGTARPSPPRDGNVTLERSKVTSYWNCGDSGQGRREFLGRGRDGVEVGLVVSFTVDPDLRVGSRDPKWGELTSALAK